jgi:NTP pyrophosphatase (non-canonical NTP hydrolase)
VRTLQRLIREWVIRCFGVDNMAPSVRALRLLEEATEFAQSCGITESEAHHQVSYTFARPMGTPSEELGGVLVTALSAAESLGKQAESLLENEVSRILSKSTAHFEQRELAKKKAGL